MKILIFIPAYNVEAKVYSVVSRIPSEIFGKNEIISVSLFLNAFSSSPLLKAELR